MHLQVNAIDELCTNRYKLNMLTFKCNTNVMCQDLNLFNFKIFPFLRTTHLTVKRIKLVIMFQTLRFSRVIFLCLQFLFFYKNRLMYLRKSMYFLFEV